MGKDLEGKVAIVTGGGSGIGAAICREFAIQGAAVAVVDRTADAAASVAQELSNAGAQAVAVEFDVTSSVEAMDAMVADVASKIGDVTVLVNCAGIGGGRPTFLEASMEVWDTVHAINFRGAFFMMQRVAQHMVGHGRGGSIINVTSAAGEVPWLKNAIYGPNKAGLKMATGYAATDLGEYGIRVNNLCPGPTETPLTAEGYADPVLRHELLSRTPLGRLGKPEDLAYGAVFLASDRSSYTTGSSLYVEGGRLVR